MTTRTKGGITIARTYDRVPQWDERNLNYHIRALIGHPTIQEKVWDLPECLDQGQEGACVGFGWTHELLAEPDRVVGVDPRAVYHRAQQIDDTPGENYSGTSVLAGAKAVQELGHLVEYRWATEVEDVLATLSVYGPVVIGVNWYEAMEDVDATGYVRPEGEIVGGHCVCLRGVIRRATDPYGWAVLGRNSWGAAWGTGGDFRLTAADLAKLMASQGDVCVPVVRVPTIITTIPEEGTSMSEQEQQEQAAQQEAQRLQAEQEAQRLQAEQDAAAQQAQAAQQEAQQDSALQTTQPDQPVPPQAAETAPDAAQAAAPVENQSAAEPRDQVAEEAQRQQEREAAQREHNARTGGGEVQAGEVEAQRQEHNERTGGGVDNPQDQA